MIHRRTMTARRMLVVIAPTVFACIPPGQGKAVNPTSYAPVVVTEDFGATQGRMSAAKSEVMKRQTDLLNERYDLGDRTADCVTMSRAERRSRPAFV